MQKLIEEPMAPNFINLGAQILLPGKKSEVPTEHIPIERYILHTQHVQCRLMFSRKSPSRHHDKWIFIAYIGTLECYITYMFCFWRLKASAVGRHWRQGLNI